jgi:hypothetical protein
MTPFSDVLFASFLFIVFSDVYNYRVAARLMAPGSFIQRMIGIFCLDFLAIPLSVFLITTYINLQGVERVMPVTYFVSIYLILLLVAGKNFLIEFILNKLNVLNKHDQ